ncbi:hypothetical protein, variant [Phialophora macrospora]|uniref:Zn(2)-C6 fungal-type domain-containing protein n=1 Tax=Phialophora macrospora TaxID=1851006 RepID=A0A0D2DY55_9EURO|nr:hypothetical protein, variant [Phialophora macrospora]
MSQTPESPISDPPTAGSSGTSTPRTRHACDSCYRRKIRCDGGTLPCDWCRHHNASCTFNRVQGGRKRRQAGSIKLRKKNIIRRMERIEQILTANFERPEAANHDPPPAGTTVLSDSPIDAVGQIFLSYYQLGDINVFHGVPLLSQDGQRWIGFRYEDSDPGKRQVPLWHNQQTPVPSGSPLRAGIQALPDRSIVEAYLTFYKTSDFANHLPLVDPVLFALTIEEAYSPTLTDSRRTSLIKAYIHAFLAVCALTDGQKEGLIPALDVKVDDVAEQLTADLFGARASTEAADTLMILVFYQFSCGNIHSADLTLSLASRILFMLGAHLYPGKAIDEIPEERQDLETRTTLHRRDLFWICYTLDMEITFRTGRPPIMTNTSCDLTFPAYYQRQISPGFTGVSRLPGDLRLSIIKSQAYEKLYSPHSLNNSDADILRDIRGLDDMLETWRLSLPAECRPTLTFSDDTKCSPKDFSPKNISPFLLRLEYHHCMTTIHQASSRCKNWTHNRTIDEGLTSSMELALESSRSLLSYLNSMGRPAFLPKLFWVVLFYPISASLILFSNILLNPSSPSAACDLRQLGECVEYVQKNFDSNVGLSESNWSHMKHVRRAAEEVFRLAQKAIAQGTQLESQAEGLEKDLERILVG